MTTDKRADKQFLLDILDAIKSINDFMAGRTKEEFNSDYLLQSAVIYQFEIIGEAASRITAETIGLYPDVNWRDISDMRNKMIHNYFEVSLDIVWNTIKDDLPRLRGQIEKIISNVETTAF